MGVRPVRLFLCGDVMTGRGVDQILSHPGDPALRERHVRTAAGYVQLAEEVNGPVPRPVDAAWVWGDLRDLISGDATDVRLVNLETTLTRSDDFAPGKAVHYRMHPENVAVLSAVKPVCALANNHMLDFGRAGLLETLDTLADAGIAFAGAGRDLEATRRPAIVELGERGRLVVFSFGTESSGVPPDWAATGNTPGIDVLPDLSPSTVDDIGDRIEQVRKAGDIVVASIHWGSNWGYEVAPTYTRFAHLLVDAGVDVVHGHSSHHPRPIEVYHDRLVLYGCGDLIDDYEGIGGHEEFRSDLRLGHIASLRPGGGELTELRSWPLQTHQMRLRHADAEDRDWLRRRLDQICRPYGVRVDTEPDGALTLRSAPGWPATIRGTS